MRREWEQVTRAVGDDVIDVVLCGAGSYDELRANAEGVARGPLTPARLAEVRSFGDAVRAQVTGAVGFSGG